MYRINELSIYGHWEVGLKTQFSPIENHFCEKPILKRKIEDSKFFRLKVLES